MPDRTQRVELVMRTDSGGLIRGIRQTETLARAFDRMKALANDTLRIFTATALGTGGLGLLLRQITRVNSEIENATLGVAGLYNTLGNNTWAASLSAARREIRGLQEDAAKGAGELSDYVLTYQYVLANAGSTLGLKRARELNRLAIAAASVEDPVTGVKNIGLDIRQALTKGVGGRDTPLINAILTKAGVSAETFGSQTTEQRVNTLFDALQKYKTAADEIGKSFSSQSQTFTDRIKSLTRAATEPLFQSWASGLEDVNKWLETVIPKVERVAAAVGGRAAPIATGAVGSAGAGVLGLTGLYGLAYGGGIAANVISPIAQRFLPPPGDGRTVRLTKQGLFMGGNSDMLDSEVFDLGGYFPTKGYNALRDRKPGAFDPFSHVGEGGGMWSPHNTWGTRLAALGGTLGGAGAIGGGGLAAAAAGGLMSPFVLTLAAMGTALSLIMPPAILFAGALTAIYASMQKGSQAWEKFKDRLDILTASSLQLYDSFGRLWSSMQSGILTLVGDQVLGALTSGLDTLAASIRVAAVFVEGMARSIDYLGAAGQTYYQAMLGEHQKGFSAGLMGPAGNVLSAWWSGDTDLSGPPAGGAWGPYTVTDRPAAVDALARDPYGLNAKRAALFGKDEFDRKIAHAWNWAPRLPHIVRDGGEDVDLNNNPAPTVNIGTVNVTVEAEVNADPRRVAVAFDQVLEQTFQHARAGRRGSHQLR